MRNITTLTFYAALFLPIVPLPSVLQASIQYPLETLQVLPIGVDGSDHLRDPNLKVETVVEELDHPTAMSFLGSSNDILVTEKDTGKVLRIINGHIQERPMLDVAVANNNGTNERGLLGMAVDRENENTTYVFLYYTESGGGQDGDDANGVVPAGNRLYRYDLIDDAKGGRLENPKLILDLPVRPGPKYNGGPLLISHENISSSNGNTTMKTAIYIMIGDLDHHQTEAENFRHGSPPDATGGILKVDINGNPWPDPPLGNGHSRSDMRAYYFAYGIRNGFGMDFDPVTGMLWDAEDGPAHADEINLVQPGFNSGWQEMQGLATAKENERVDSKDLEDFNGAGVYRDPEFVWQTPVGVTALKFFNSTKLGEPYENDMFVGDINGGTLYHFDLNQNRTGLALNGALADKVADNESELASVIFGTGFGGITDIEVGPDGYLYLLLYGGEIVKVVPQEAGGQEGPRIQ
jgi:glucose/arabinose dehydrogenase